MRRVTVAAVIASLLILATGPSIQALPPREVERHYYSDQTFTTEVGFYLLGCGGAIIREGTATSYYVQYTTPCDGVGQFTCGRYICTWKFAPGVGWYEDCVVDTCQ